MKPNSGINAVKRLPYRSEKGPHKNVNIPTMNKYTDTLADVKSWFVFRSACIVGSVGRLMVSLIGSRNVEREAAISTVVMLEECTRPYALHKRTLHAAYLVCVVCWIVCHICLSSLWLRSRVLIHWVVF